MSAAQKNENQLAGWQFVNQNTTTAIVAPADDSCNCEKRIATLRAKFAIAGFAVHGMDDGGFLVCRWNMSRPCADLAALAAFARLTGVSK